jgi:hypothetical protein
MAMAMASGTFGQTDNSVTVRTSHSSWSLHPPMMAVGKNQTVVLAVLRVTEPMTRMLTWCLPTSPPPQSMIIRRRDEMAWLVAGFVRAVVVRVTGLIALAAVAAAAAAAMPPTVDFVVENNGDGTVVAGCVAMSLLLVNMIVAVAVVAIVAVPGESIGMEVPDWVSCVTGT